MRELDVMEMSSIIGGKPAGWVCALAWTGYLVALAGLGLATGGSIGLLIAAGLAYGIQIPSVVCSCTSLCDG